MKRTALALSLSCAIAVPAPAAAAITVFSATLNGSQVNPPNLSTATGSATVTVDDVLQTLSVNLLFSGLTVPATASHIHCCAPPGTSAPVVIPMVGFPASTSGAYNQTFDSLTPSGFQNLLAGMLAGNSYIDIHNSIYPGGEISGQLHAVPEPSTWMMMLLGFGAMGASLRLRRKPPVEAKA